MTDKPTFDPLRSRNIRTMLVSEAENDTSAGAGLSRRIAVLVALAVAAVVVSTGGVALALTGNIPFIDRPPVPVASSAVPQPTETPTSTPTPTPTPTETPAPVVDSSAPQSWIIADGTVGPLSLGQLRKSAAGAMSAFTTAPYQCDVDVYSSTSSRMQIVLTPDPSGSSIAAIAIDSSGDPASPSPRTAEGIGLGSTADQILAAYPNIQRPDPRLYPTYSLAEPDGTWIDFSMDRESSTVIAISVLRSSYPPPEYCG